MSTPSWLCAHKGGGPSSPAAKSAGNVPMSGPVRNTSL